MASYRFCRPDDVPFLVRAINDCYTVHFPHLSPMTIDGFRSEMRRFDVWPSNSMVAIGPSGAEAVLIGTKRSREVLVSRIGVHPDHLRQGHATHLLTSLSQKLAVLGPERLVVEIPRSLDGAIGLFEGLGYRHETTCVDFLRPPGPVEPPPEEWLIPITVGEVVEQGLLDGGRDSPWSRSRDTLMGSRDEVLGLAIASPEALEAFLLYRRDARRWDIVALGGREADQCEVLFGVLLRSLANRTELPLRFPKLLPGEIPLPVLQSLGFVPGARHDRYTKTAKAA